MATYAIVSSGVVTGINVTTINPGEGWQLVPDGVQLGWVDDGNGGLEAPPAPTPAHRPLTRLEFVRLCITAGGMTSMLLVQAKADPYLEALWIMLDFCIEIKHDDEDIGPGLAALDALGYLPGGAAAVFAAWPTE